MAASSFNCSLTQGYNFQKDSQSVIGHITSLKIGDTELKADTGVLDPGNIQDENKVKVVGVVSGIHWEGGYADPVSFNCQVSTANKETIALLHEASLSNTSVEVNFIIYDYDPVKEVFYRAFHSNKTALKGLLEKSGGKLSLGINLDQSTDVTSPKNYTLYLGLMPQEETQEIHISVSSDSKFVKKWGAKFA